MASDKRATLIAIKKDSQRPTNVRDTVNIWFKEFTGCALKDISSCESIVQLLHSPRDGSSLAVARIFFGLTMMIDCFDERAGFELDTRWGDEKDCRFTLFPIVQPMTMPRMGILYGIMFLGALGIALGYKFTASCCMYAIPYWYIILLDKSVWNNHSYLFGLMAILFACSSANKCLSLDSYFQHSIKMHTSTSLPKEGGNIVNKSPSNHSAHPNPGAPAAVPAVPATAINDNSVPFWNYFIIKFQYYVLYTAAGVYKLSPEWLSGYSMANLGNHWVFTPFRMFLGTVWTDLLIIHWLGCIFDLTIAFWLTHKRTRVTGTVIAISFHLMNSRLFTIGMFPWLCLLHLPLFYAVDWPRKWMASARGRTPEKSLTKCSQVEFHGDDDDKHTKKMQIKSGNKLTTVLLGIYIFLQLFLPHSHFITKGYNNWTKGLYGYSWNMMVNSWQPILTSIKIVDNSSNKTLYLEPTAFAENNRWSRHADMAKQYAECIQRNLQQSVNEPLRHRDRTSSSGANGFGISAENISIYFDVWCSMNSRFQQRVFDPRVDILKAEWSPWHDTQWVLPILSQFTDLRPQLLSISEHVFGWNNYSDVLFIADYPGLSLDNYVVETADNVTLTVLEGSVRLSYDDSSATRSIHPPTPVTLTKGQSIPIHRQTFHNIHVVSETPASYMYTYTNATMMGDAGQGASSSPAAEEQAEKDLLPLWAEIKERWNKFELFLQHVLNSLLHEIYGVPFPSRVLERDG